MEGLAHTLYTDKKIKGPEVKEVIKAFNSFESHERWCIDSGPSADGYGVQLVIVWDGEIPPAEQQVQVLPIVPENDALPPWNGTSKQSPLRKVRQSRSR